jgi:hypothetical protein
MIANTAPAPYYAVIFTSLRTDGDHGYEQNGLMCSTSEWLWCSYGRHREQAHSHMGLVIDT